MNMKKYIPVFCVALCTSFSITSHAADAPKALYHMHDSKELGASSIYEYHPTSVYTIDTSKNYIADVALHPGETIQYIGGGDTLQWLIDTSTVSGTPHLYIKPLKDGIRTNIIVNTNNHTYHLALRSTDHYSLVSFTYPQDIERQRQAELLRPVYKDKKEKEFLDTHTKTSSKGGTELKNLNYRYQLKNHNVPKDLIPTEIYDDAVRSYIQVSSQTKYNYPTLYILEDDNSLTLVNYRIIGSYLVADRVFTKARLVYGKNKYIDITPNKEVMNGRQ